MKKASFIVYVICALMFSQLFIPVVLAENSDGLQTFINGDFEYSVCPDNAEEEYRGTLEITGYLGTETDVVIPAQIDGKRVAVIGDYLFYKNEKIKSIQLPDTLISIGTESFSLCKSLSRINIPVGVKEIGGAFRGCESLTEIAIPEGVEYIYYHTFKDCTSLEKVKFPNSLKQIYDFAFENCSSLSEITLPDSVEQIWSGVFSGCTSLSKVNLPKSLSYIGKGVFTGSAVYNDSTNWFEGALYISDCLVDSKREMISDEFTVKDGTTIIAENALSKAEDLKSLILPESLKSICSSAFAGCCNLKTVEIAKGLEQIGDNSFRECGIEYLIVPEGVTTIGENAFVNCKLRNVTLPKSIEIIGDGAFDSNSIHTVRYNGTEKEWIEKQFEKSFIAFYASFLFNEDDQESNASEESTVSVQTESVVVSSESDANDREEISSIIIIIISIVAFVACVIAVVCAKRKRMS